MRNAVTAPVAVLIVALASGCSSPVIYDLEGDKVLVQSTSADAATMQTADEGCGIHGKKAVGPLSNRCIDGYCIRKVFLFACKDAPSRVQQTLRSRAASGYAPVASVRDTSSQTTPAAESAVPIQ